MITPLLGLHHVTAVTADAKRNLNFYTQALGMRLVKKTVNQDDVSAYHLFYADHNGSPGTDLTFFDWPTVGPNLKGTGVISQTSLRVNGEAAVQWWAERFHALGIPCDAIAEGEEGAFLSFSDPEGQALRIVDDRGASAGIPEQRPDIPPEFALRGLDSVRIDVADPEREKRFLTETLGFRALHQESASSLDSDQIFEMGNGGSGARLRMTSSQPHRGRVGAGGVHHAAFRVADVAHQEEWRQWLLQAQVGVTPIIDRFYFQSIYFRSPGGILFEIATDGPGFASDEPLDQLGNRLSLPPFLEPQRAQIERGLRPLD